MQLNIKDRDVVRRVKQLADHKRVSAIQVIRDALTREEQAVQAKPIDDDTIRRELAEIHADMAPLIEEARSLGMSSDHRWIYEDENGDPLW